MDNNKKQIKAINKTAIIQELVEKSKNCSLFWSDAGMSQYRAGFANYNFYLTKTSTNTYNLDVIKNGSLYTSYNSILNSNVKNLYDIVESLVSESNINKFRRVNEFLGRKGSCRQGEIGSSNKLYSINLQGFGLKSSGLVSPQILRRRLSYLNPTQIDFDPTYPWSGTYQDIDDFDVFLSNDGDSSYIRQEVFGFLPTNWGYLDVGFNLSSIPTKPPFVVHARVAARRETQPGVSLIISMIINESNVFQQTIELNETYYSWASGDTYLDSSTTSIESLKIRIVPFTNSGNLLPRATRITGVDLGVYGYDPI